VDLKERLRHPATRRTCVLAGAAVALGLVVWNALAGRAEHQRTLELLDSTGLSQRQPDVARAAARDPDPTRARLAIARALLAESFDYRSFALLPVREAAESAARVNERLELAREIAAQALARRPSAWQAAMILGGATYRLWSSCGDPRLVSDSGAWEGPLLAACRLAPGEDEPLRVLAVAWLEVWPSLSAAKRNETLITLRRAFMDPETFARCADLWLAAAPTREEAFALVPDDTRAWLVLEGRYAAAGRWEEFCAARQRRDETLERELKRRVSDIRVHLRGGDPSGARSLAVDVVSTAPVETRFRDVVKEALTLCPPRTVISAEPFHRWLSWALEGSVRGQERLPPETVARLAAASGELSAPEAAFAQLAAGSLAEAEVIERRSEALNTEAWAPYWIAKARLLARQRRGFEAASTLALVNRRWRSSVPAAEARLAIAEASGEPVASATARDALAVLAATSWPATAWEWRGPVAHLDLLAARDARDFTLSFDSVPPKGAALQVRVDGETVAVAPVADGATLRIVAKLAPGAHLVEVEPLAGGRIFPGTLSLVAD
jgi:hypothetical protein